MNTSLDAAARFLKDEVGVTTDRLLPYAMQLVVISSMHFEAPEPSPAQRALLRQWFWVTSFAQWFGGANPSRVNALVRDVIDNVAQERETPQFNAFDLNTPASPLPRSFDMRSARTRVLLLVLFSLRPRSRGGAVIADPAALVARFGPEALGYVASTVSDNEMLRSPANRILRDDPIDRGQARNWLKPLTPTVHDEVWRSHALPLQAADLLLATDASAFLMARQDEMIRVERQFMEQVGVTPPSSDAPTAAPADTE